jgi:hypothetical protein
MACTADFGAQSSSDEEEAEGLLVSSHLDETAALPADLGQSGYDVIPDDEHIIGSKAKTPGVSS